MALLAAEPVLILSAVWIRAGALRAGRSEQGVQCATLDVADQRAQLSDAHLNPLTEIVGDHDSAFVLGISIDPEFWASTVALSAECGYPLDVVHAGVPFQSAREFLLHDESRPNG